MDKTGQGPGEIRAMPVERADDEDKDEVHQTMTDNGVIPKQTSDVADMGSV